VERAEQRDALRLRDATDESVGAQGTSTLTGAILDFNA